MDSSGTSWHSISLSNAQSIVTDQLPNNATITNARLLVEACFDGGFAAQVYLSAGYSSSATSITNKSISSVQISKTKKAYYGGYELSNLFSTTTYPFTLNSQNGTLNFITAGIQSKNTIDRNHYVNSLAIEVDYTVHEHSYTSTITVNPTCTSPGVTQYACSCGHSYTDSTIPPALGHSWGEVRYIWTETSTGFQCVADRLCNRSGCSGYEYADATVTPSVKTPATCTERGTTSYTANFNVGWATTQVKDVQNIPPTGHTWVNATCTAPRTCSVCGATDGSALGHMYSDTVVSPTEDSHGYTRHTCSRCGHSFEDNYTYLVRWYNENGTELLETDPSVPYGTMPEYNGTTPTKAATAQYTYEHFGWNISPLADGKIDLTPVIANVKYYARFKSTTINYRVEWLNDDGTVLEEAEWVPYGEKPSYDGSTPTKPDSSDGKYRYEFLGWSVKDVDDGYYDESELEPVTGHITYEAVYLPIVKQYHLSFITDDCAIEMTINDVPIEGDIDGYYDYGTFFRLKIVPDFGYEAVGVQFIDPNGDDSAIFPGDSLIFMVTQDEILKCVCERKAAPFFISPEQQVQMVYVVPAINTIVYRVEGDLPTLEAKMQSVNDWRFDVINTDIEEKYGLYVYYEVEQLYMSDGKSIVNKRIW